MVPNLLFDPVSDVREAPARVSYRKVLHPATQNRVDLRNHLADWPGPMAAENLLERLQQRRPLLDSRREQRHPSVSPAANATELQSDKSEGHPLRGAQRASALLGHPRPRRRSLPS